MRKTLIQCVAIVVVSLVCGAVYALILQWRESENALPFTTPDGFYPDPLTCTYVSTEAKPSPPGKTVKAVGGGKTTEDSGGETPKVIEPTVSEDGIPRIGVELAIEYWEDGAIFIDARRTKEYNEGHVPGAISIPAWEPARRSRGVEQMAENYAREEPVVVYCTEDPNCVDSKTIAQALQGYDFVDVTVFIGGYPAWKKAGHKVHIGSDPGPGPGEGEE